MDHRSRRDRLSDRFGALGVEAFLVTRLPNVRYLTGFTGSNAQLLLAAEPVLLTDGRYDEQSRHEVPDLRRVIYHADLIRALAAAVSDAGIGVLGFESKGITHETFRRLDEALDAELVAATDEVERARWTKDLEEIELLEEAQRLTDEAFEVVTGKLVEGATEEQVALELELAMRRAGADRVGFDTIVAFGENAAEPHHHPTDRPLGPGDLVKLDFGCVVDGYHSDMTRTVAFGRLDTRLREVYELVLAAQLTAIGAIAAGVTGADADAAARAPIEEAGHGERFGHSLGHGLGLEVHEGPTLRRTSEEVLPEGAVVTVEPGVYLPGVGGVRIEDAVVVERDGCRPLPSTAKELITL